MVIRAKYEDGVFKPLDAVRLKEGTILDIYVPKVNRPACVIKDPPFAGLWKDRSDIPDGITYVNRLRDAPRA